MAWIIDHFQFWQMGTIFRGSEPQKIMLIVMSLASAYMEGFVYTWTGIVFDSIAFLDSFYFINPQVVANYSA